VWLELKDLPKEVAWVIARTARCSSSIQTAKVGKVPAVPIIHSARNSCSKVPIIDKLISAWETTVPGG
jgi:hypothetical protein